MAKFCSQCGSPLRETDKFCRKCGAAVRLQSQATQTQSQPPQTQSPAPSYSAPSAPAAPFENPEGTVLLGNMKKADPESPSVKKAEIHLSLNEMLEGCSKVVDFGTGKKYELSIPAGLSPEDMITVEPPGLVDSDTGRPCKIELTVML